MILSIQYKIIQELTESLSRSVFHYSESLTSQNCELTKLYRGVAGKKLTF